MEEETKKEIFLWAGYILILISLGSLLFYGGKYLSINYKMRVCLEEFEKEYSIERGIYQYDKTCQKIFSTIENSKYCKKKSNPEFCYYSLTKFIENQEQKATICEEIKNDSLRKFCI